MSIRTVQINDNGSPVRSSSRRLDLPEMSQSDMIPDPLHVRRSMDQEDRQQQHRTENLGRDSSPEEADDKENAGIRRRSRSSTSSSHRSPFDKVPKTDPRRSSERIFGTGLHPQELLLDPFSAAGISSAYESNINTASTHATGRTCALVPSRSYSSNISLRSSTTRGAPPRTRGNTASPSTTMSPSRRRHPRQPTNLRTAPPIPPGGSHASAAQREANHIPYPDERHLSPTPPPIHHTMALCAQCGGQMADCVVVDGCSGAWVCSVRCKTAFEDKMLRESIFGPASVPYRLCARCLSRTDRFVTVTGQPGVWVCSVACKLAQEAEAGAAAGKGSIGRGEKKTVWVRVKRALKKFWEKK